MDWSIQPAPRRAAFCAACCDDPGSAAVCTGTRSRSLHGIGGLYGGSTGVFSGERPHCLCGRCCVGGCDPHGSPELCGRAEQRRSAALVYGSSCLCRSRCGFFCVGDPAAGCPETAAYAASCDAAGGAAAGGPQVCRSKTDPQTTPERKKNCRKKQKELAKPAAYVV